MIEDEELRQLFAAGCGECLDCLADGARRLVEAPDERAPLAEMLLAAHSLKGGARMLEVEDVRLVACQMEKQLQAVARGQVTLSVEAMRRLGLVADDVRALVREAVTGEPARVSTLVLLDRLAGRDDASAG